MSRSPATSTLQRAVERPFARPVLAVLAVVLLGCSDSEPDGSPASDLLGDSSDTATTGLGSQMGTTQSPSGADGDTMMEDSSATAEAGNVDDDTGEDPPPPEDPFVENQGANCEIGPLPGAVDDPNLPDPFMKLDGERMTTVSQWRCRRQEILRTAEEQIYGVKPPRPDRVTGSVSEEGITVEVSHQGLSTSFSAGIQLPAGGSPPYPAIIGLGGGFFLGLDANLIMSEGVAIIEYDPYAVGSEMAPRDNKQGAFYDIYGADSETGLLVAWSWGVSRIIDVIEESNDDLIITDALAVTGCSRFGKGAFTIGALDQRIALTIPFESGSGGVPIWRGIPAEGAQSPSSAYAETYWLGDAFGDFTGNVEGLAVDTHQVVAMIAPRGLLILDNPHIANLGPRSAHVAALAGAEVYAALGAADNISYHSNVASGAHCSWRPEFEDPLRQNIRTHLSKTGNAPGVITAHPSAAGDLAQWVDWDTPMLE